MKRIIIFLAAFCNFYAASAQVKKIETEHFISRFDPEVEAYARASLQVLEKAWSISTNNGFLLPDKLKFTIVPSERNALYFHRKNLKEIIWEYSSVEDFLPPDQSRKNNIYGLCHELGHLCMYNVNNNRNGWMSYDYREAWADYFGNVLIDSIYEDLGTDFWPEPHDYTRYAGTDYFINRIGEDNPQLLSFNRACLFWYELGEKIGFSNINQFFGSIRSQKVENPDAKEEFAAVLKDYLDTQEFDAWYQKYSDYLILE